jgi:AcrR family transcriptional regulator
MCQSVPVTGTSTNPRDPRRAAIHAAAIREFSARGFAATSMVHIAAAAGMSRPALYQYFDNKRDIFASAFASLVDDAADHALAALAEPGTWAERLDQFLQRFDGDLFEQMAASPHSLELLEAKHQHAADAWVGGMQRLHAGLAAQLRRTGAPKRRRSEWMEMLELSPKGFKLDHPTVAVYRRRLATLARGVAADIESSTAT